MIECLGWSTLHPSAQILRLSLYLDYRRLLAGILLIVSGSSESMNFCLHSLTLIMKKGKNYLLGLHTHPTITPKEGGWAQIRYVDSGKTVAVSPR